MFKTLNLVSTQGHLSAYSYTVMYYENAHTTQIIDFQCVYLLTCAMTVYCLGEISDSFPTSDNYTGIQSPALHLCIINHLTGRPVRID